MLFVPRDDGQGLVEYALILVLVSIVVIAILTLLGPTIGNVFSGTITRVWERCPPVLAGEQRDHTPRCERGFVVGSACVLQDIHRA